MIKFGSCAAMEASNFEGLVQSFPNYFKLALYSRFYKFIVLIGHGVHVLCE